MATQQTWTGIKVETSFFPLSFFLYLCTPTIIIDGVVYQRPWGTHSFQLPGGMRNVRIFFKYLFMDTCGMATINVVVQPNCIHRIKYEWAFLCSRPVLSENCRHLSSPRNKILANAATLAPNFETRRFECSTYLVWPERLAV